MKRIYIILLAVASMVSFSACHEEYTTYQGDEYVMFADTLSVNVVEQNNETFSVKVASTVTCDYDRTFGVEVVDKGSNAIEGKHFSLVSNSVIIPAGKSVGEIKLRGYYDNIGEEDSLGVVLRLIAPENVKWDLYEEWSEHKATFYKSCPWDINNFSGWCVLTSLLLYSYPGEAGVFQKLVKVDQHPTLENHVILRNAFYEGYDITIGFDPSDAKEPLVTMDEGQVVSDEGSVFGQFHGDDKVLVKESPYNDSYYNSCQKFVVLYTYVYVENIGEAVGSVGDFYNVFEFVSEAEAERIQREGL